MSYIDWDKVIGKKVRDLNGQEIGEVENVNPDFIEVKDGLIAKRHYYIPKASIQWMLLLTILQLPSQNKKSKTDFLLIILLQICGRLQSVSHCPGRQVVVINSDRRLLLFYQKVE